MSQLYTATVIATKSLEILKSRQEFFWFIFDGKSNQSPTYWQESRSGFINFNANARSFSLFFFNFFKRCSVSHRVSHHSFIFVVVQSVPFICRFCVSYMRFSFVSLQKTFCKIDSLFHSRFHINLCIFANVYTIHTTPAHHSSLTCWFKSVHMVWNELEILSN